jgi:glutaredoxin
MTAMAIGSAVRSGRLNRICRKPGIPPQDHPVGLLVLDRPRRWPSPSRADGLSPQVRAAAKRLSVSNVSLPPLPSLSPLSPRVALYTRPGCHLCDDAREVVEKVTADLGESYEERDITKDPELHRRYLESIPVVEVDGVQVDFWRVSEDRLRAALLG